MDIGFTPVTSSNIDAMAHSGSELFVKFKTGKVYRYDGVPETIYQQILTAESVGKAFNQMVKAAPETYPFVCLN